MDTSFTQIKDEHPSTVFIISREKSSNIVLYNYDGHSVSSVWLMQDNNKNELEPLNGFEKSFYRLTWDGNLAHFARFQFTPNRVLEFVMDQGEAVCFTTINGTKMKLERIHIHHAFKLIKPTITSFVLYGRDDKNSLRFEVIHRGDFSMHKQRN